MDRSDATNRSANAATLLEVAEVELVDLDTVDAGQRLGRDVGPPGRHDDVRAGPGERAGRLQPDAGVAAGDDGETAGEVDAGDHLGRGGLGAEAGPDGMLRRAHPATLRSHGATATARVGPLLTNGAFVDDVT